MASGFVTLPDAVFFRPAQQEDLASITALELASYPADEAATPEKLAYRMHNAGDFFMVAVKQEAAAYPSEPDGDDSAAATHSDTIVGFVCGTCTSSERYSHACMSHHEPEGARLCIHSVVVREDLRRRGLAQRMLRAYFMFMQGTAEHVIHVHLVSKALLVPLYEKSGLTVVGPAQLEHGADSWIELALEFGQ
ncbi:MAG: hypothetical protein WDW38_006790 [Sanguina aurantia]